MPGGRAGALPSAGCVLLVVAAALIHCSLEADYTSEKSCRTDEFQCDSGQCTNRSVLCNGTVECQDGSDETSEVCRSWKCPTYSFPCAYGACVVPEARCNNIQECADGSDEKDCPGSSTSNSTCKSGQFICYSGVCLDGFLLCDGTKDCDDGSDETEMECSSLKCPSSSFRCSYGACIDASGVCNGVEQCADGSDENICAIPSAGNIPSIPGKYNFHVKRPVVDCKLPPQPANGQYRLGGCDPPECEPVPGQNVSRTSYIVYTCHSEHKIVGSQILLCEVGWSSAFPTCSRVSCPSLTNPTTEIECNFNGNDVNHYEAMAPGTRCIVRCTTFYTTAPELTNFITHCQDNGKWSRDVLPCTPKCGEPNPRGRIFVAGGKQSQFGEFPWHAGIYQMVEGKFHQVCGGNIISERVIVTAAHCFWDVTTGTRLNFKDFRVAVGKYHREWEERRTKFIQFPEIEEIVLHKRFRGEQINWQNDIALIKLKDSLQITAAVRPICLDFEKEQERFFTPGKSGTVMGWGYTENMTQSETIRETILPYVSFEVCFDEVPYTFRPYLTRDKFCAGTRNGTSVCPGDSGGGYAVQFRDGKWYLMGIVSVGVPSSNADVCNFYHYTTFTKVSDFYEFIRNSPK